MSGTITYTIANEAQLNADIAAIDLGGTASATNTNYIFVLTADLALSSNITAISLASGDTLTITGNNIDGNNLSSTIDGGGTMGGFVVNSGSVTLNNLNLTALSAPGGTGGVPSGGGALYVAAGASVTTTSVSFTGDTATGGTAAGGAVFVAQGGTLDIASSSVAGSGKAAGSGIFIQGNNSIILNSSTITGVIGDQSGSHLGTGAGSVVADGLVTLTAANTYTGGTTVNGTLTLTAPAAAGTGEISFGAPTGDTLVIGAGDVPANLIGGFVPNPGVGSLNSDVIGLQSIGVATGYTLSPANQLTLTGGAAPVTLNLDPAVSYAAASFVLQSDGTGGTRLTVVQSTYLVASEADLNAALAEIDVGGKAAAPGMSYSIALTASFTLTTDLYAIQLMAGDSVTIDGAGNTLDGGGVYRGFLDYAGGLTLENITIQNAVASGGAGGSGATPGGGGAGLGGGLFVGSGGAATLSNVTFLNDSATGGSAGTPGGIGIGGGGGLGGSGGAGTPAHFPADGGGGGVGIAANGGSGSFAAGGPGLFAGAGGGGESGGTKVTVTHGSGRGATTHTTYTDVLGKGGGLSGFGGGAASGGAAGFGGGGANSAGGFGGGGSGANLGGYGGGAGGVGGAGGGAGLGGGIFVQQGGSLTIISGSDSGGGVAGGAGSDGGGSGAASGAGLFIQGAGSVTLAPAAGQIVSIADAIGDQGGNGGAGSLIVNGAGTVVLSGNNTYSGGTTLQNGTLSLQAPGSAGTGEVVFAYAAATTLVIGAGDVPANVISDFLPNDTIDLQGIGTATSAIADANNVLTIAGGTTDVTLQLDPTQSLAGETFNIASDGNGGTLVTATDIAGDMPPSIAGNGTLAGDDHTPLNPFAAVTVSDVDPGQTETVTVTQSDPANGTFSDLSGGTYDPAAGTYTVSGSAAVVTAALQALVFTPTEYQIAPSQTVTTEFTLSASDGTMTAIPRIETVAITALNDSPVINSANQYGFVEGEWNAPFAALQGLTVVDPDFGATETVTIQVEPNGLYGYGITSDANGTLSLSMAGVTLTKTGIGTYSLSAGSPTQITAALDAIQFDALPNPVTPGYTITYLLTTVSDGIAPPVINRTEVLTGLPIFLGLVANQTATDGQPTMPFATASVIESAGLSIQGFTIILNDASSDYLHPTDANGILTGASLTKTGAGTYVLAPGDTATVTAELQGLTFTPAAGNGTTTTDFTLEAFDGATTASNGIAVTALPGPPVAAIAGTAGGQSVLDNATIAPFAAVAITDANANPSDAATIVLVDGYSLLATDANGTLSGAGLTQTGVGTYTLAATDPATLSQELAALVFTPALDQVAPGYAAITDFNLSVTDVNGTVTDANTSVYAYTSAVDPTIAGTVWGQLVADDGSTIDPFSAVTVTDTNAAPSDTAIITVNDISAGLMIATPSDADGTLFGAGLSYVGTGTYVLAATDPATLSAELNALVFTPTPNLVTAGQTVTTSFTLQIADNLATATDYNTQVVIVASSPPTIAIDPVAGSNSVNAATALAGFAITGETANVEDGQTVWVLIYDPAAGGYSAVLSAAVSGGIWSAELTPDQALALGDGSFTAYAYATNQAGLTTQTASDNFSVDLAGAYAATPVIGTTALAFGSMRVGAPAVTLTTTIADGSVANPDQSSLSYALGALPLGFAADATASGSVDSGGSALLDLTLTPSSSGVFANMPVSVALTSLAPTGSGLTDAALPDGTLTLSAKIYAPAVAQVTSSIDFGVVHVGDKATQSLVVTNAASGALTDVLTGGFGTIAGPFTGSGTLGTGLAAGASGALTLTLKTSVSGVIAGSAALNFASHDADLANIAVSAAPVALTGIVDNYAVASLEKVSGAGTLSHSGTSYTLNLGTVAQNAAALTATWGALNSASGLADLLSGGFSVSGSAAFGNTGLGAFAGLGAGQADTAPVVTLSTGSAGMFSETITLNATGSNASGYSGALAAETLTITGTVTPTVFALTAGVDTVAGTSANDTILATSNTLSASDNIAGGAGTNTLALRGGGTFDLTQPATLTGIQIITAQEGQGATAQTVTLRAGLNATVNVASDGAGDTAPTITIIGASNADTINLGTGNDIVTLGAGEVVNGGGGNNVFNVTSATIKATINGGTGTNTLIVNGGGSVTMGSAIKGISNVVLSSPTTFTANATANLHIAGNVAGGDTIVLGAATQAVTSGGANETVKATAANAGASVSGLGASSTLEITSGGTVALNAASSVTTVKLDAATMLSLNGMQFITVTGSTGADTIVAGAINQTLTGGSGVDTLVGYSGGSDLFRDTVSGLNGDTIQGFLASDTIDLTNLGFAGAKLSVAASGGNTVVTATSGATKAVFTMSGSFSGAGFSLASDGVNGTFITHS